MQKSLRLLLTLSLTISLATQGTSHVFAMAAHIEELLEEENYKATNQLWNAISASNSTAVVNALAAGANINSKNAEGLTPLHVASCFGPNKIVTILIRAGANIYSLNNDGQTALHLAAISNQFSIAHRILQTPGDQLLAQDFAQIEDINGKTALDLAIINRHQITINMLRRYASQEIAAQFIKLDGDLLIAAAAADADAISALLAAGANVDAEDTLGRRAIHYVAQSRNHNAIKAVETLIRAEAKIAGTDRYNWRALHFAVSSGNIEIVNLLLVKDVYEKINDHKYRAKYGLTFLHLAAGNGRADIATLLITAGANINAQDTYGNTALHSAARFGHVEAVKTLLLAGADSTIINTEGEHPSLCASKNGFSKLVKMLEDNRIQRESFAQAYYPAEQIYYPMAQECLTAAEPYDSAAHAAWFYTQ